MKKYFKRKKASFTPQDDFGASRGLIDKMQEQMSAIEKKLDILISRSPNRPFEKSYSQNPPRSFDRSERYDRGRRGGGPRERTYTRVICADCGTECEIPFKPSAGRPVYCKECFSKRKNNSPFNARRDNRPEERDFHREQHPDKRQPEKKHKPAKHKK